MTSACADLNHGGTVVQSRRSKSAATRLGSPNVLPVPNRGDAWSDYLRRMVERPGWSVARLARESGLHRSAIFGWLSDGAEGITIRSVYLIADALGVDREEALRAAGNLPPERDAEVELILASGRSELEKVAMIDRLMRRREEERLRRLEDLRFVLGQDAS